MKARLALVSSGWDTRLPVSARSTRINGMSIMNGQIVLVTKLREGQHATVLQLPASPVVTPIKTHDQELLEV